MATARRFESKCGIGKRMVAAIDIGATLSGYAYSFKCDYESYPTKVSINNAWTAGINARLSLKTSTTLLLNPDKSFRGFGSEAEDVYCDLALEDMHRDYYFFKHFHMNIMNKYSPKPLERHMEIEDDSGKCVKAMTVFGMSIKYMGTDIRERDIRWVLPVPADWSYSSQQFMREAAEVAGIRSSDLLIAPYPEAAAAYFMHMPAEVLSGPVIQHVVSFRKDAKYMVVNIGEMTLDITVHEVVDDFTLSEVEFVSYEIAASQMEDKAFEQLLVKLVGKDVFKKFSEDHKDDLTSLFREFETKKYNVKLDNSLKETIRLPAMLTECYKDIKDRPFKTAVAECHEYKGKITSHGDKLRIAADIMRGFFQEPCEAVRQHVDSSLKEKRCSDVKTLLLVGGLAESPVLKETFYKNFPNLSILIPPDAGIAVLKGAVIYGHNPTTMICSRAA